MSIAGAAVRIEEIQQQIRAYFPTGDASKTSATGATNFAAALAGIQDQSAYLSTEVIGQDIVDLAEKFVGIPQVEGGDTPNGVDASGLVYRVLTDLGVEVPRSAQEQAALGYEVGSLASAKPGDLLVGKDGHIAIYAGDGKIVHAPQGGKHVELVDNPYTDATLATIRRIVPETYTYTGAGQAQPAAASAQAAAIAQTQPAKTTPASAAATAASVSAASQAMASSIAAQLLLATGQPGTADVSQTLSTLASAGALNAAARTVAPMLGASTADDAVAAVAAAAASALSTGSPDTAAPVQQTAAPLPANVKAHFQQQISAPVLNLTQASDGEHSLTLRVSPENLGPVTLKAQIMRGAIHIELASATDMGRDALRSILVDLRRDLAALAPASSIAITTGDSTAGQSQQGQGQAGSGLQSGAGGNSSGGGAGQNGNARTAAGAEQRSAAPVPTPTPTTDPLVPTVGIDLYA